MHLHTLATISGMEVEEKLSFVWNEEFNYSGQALTYAILDSEVY